MCMPVVDEKERKNGNDPEKELVDSGFHDYRRPLVAFVSSVKYAHSWSAPNVRRGANYIFL